MRVLSAKLSRSLSQSCHCQIQRSSHPDVGHNMLLPSTLLAYFTHQQNTILFDFERVGIPGFLFENSSKFQMHWHPECETKKIDFKQKWRSCVIGHRIPLVWKPILIDYNCKSYCRVPYFHCTKYNFVLLCMSLYNIYFSNSHPSPSWPSLSSGMSQSICISGNFERNTCKTWKIVKFPGFPRFFNFRFSTGQQIWKVYSHVFTHHKCPSSSTSAACDSVELYQTSAPHPNHPLDPTRRTRRLCGYWRWPPRFHGPRTRVESLELFPRSSSAGVKWLAAVGPQQLGQVDDDVLRYNWIHQCPHCTSTRRVPSCSPRTTWSSSCRRARPIPRLQTFLWAGRWH